MNEKTRIEVYEETNEIDWKNSWLELTIWISFIFIWVFILSLFINIVTRIEDEVLKAFSTIVTLLILLRMFPWSYPNIKNKLRLKGVKYE